MKKKIRFEMSEIKKSNFFANVCIDFDSITIKIYASGLIYYSYNVKSELL